MSPRFFHQGAKIVRNNAGFQTFPSVFSNYGMSLNEGV